MFKINIKLAGRPLAVRGITKDDPDRTERILAKIKSEDGQLPEIVEYLYAGCQDMPQVCIDWYWVTYNSYTGAVESENFLYTTCYDPCSFNSSGGGGTGTGSCQDAAEDIESGPIATEAGVQSLSQSGSERSFSYSWIFHKQYIGLWHYKSIETGVHEKQPNNSWKWKSLTHSSVTRVGLVVGGSVDCNINSAIPEVGIYNAGMKLNYTISGSVVCKGFPVSFSDNYNNNSPIWHVTYQGPIQ